MFCHNTIYRNKLHALNLQIIIDTLYIIMFPRYKYKYFQITTYYLIKLILKVRKIIIILERYLKYTLWTYYITLIFKHSIIMIIHRTILTYSCIKTQPYSYYI